MIKTIALGVVCLAGLAAIVAVGKRPTPLPVSDVVMPVVAGNKADRLPIQPKQAILANADAADIVNVPSAEEELVTPPQPASKEEVRPSSNDIVRHAAHENRAKVAKQKVRNPQHPKEQPAEVPPKPLTEVRVECRSDGLQPLLAKLNLPCITVQR